MSSFDVITFGSGTWDVTMTVPENFIKRRGSFVSRKGFAFNLGTKIDIPAMQFAFGGGGVNSAVALADLGFKTAYCGMVGADIPGRQLKEYLKERGVATKFIKETAERSTNNSVILNAPSKDRVILVYRGASEMLAKEHLDFESMAAKLFYIAPLSGKLSSLTQEIIRNAQSRNIKIAANPGRSQLTMAKAKMWALLAQVDYLILNKEEAALLTNQKYANEKQIIKKLLNIHPGINAITKGRHGAIVTDGRNIYEAKGLEFKVTNATGAGDAFSSGFIARLLGGGSIIDALRLGMSSAKHRLTAPAKDFSYHAAQRENIQIKAKRI